MKMINFRTSQKSDNTYRKDLERNHRGDMQIRKEKDGGYSVFIKFCVLSKKYSRVSVI